MLTIGPGASLSHAMCLVGGRGNLTQLRALSDNWCPVRVSSAFTSMSVLDFSGFTEAENTVWEPVVVAHR